MLKGTGWGGIAVTVISSGSFKLLIELVPMGWAFSEKS